jgi:Na+-transporting methylmalonyl-CoA/oxaloacetate decarboxylase gamma subunit
MAESGSSFWKIMFGVGCGVVLAVLVMLGMCTMCVGKVALDTTQQIEKQKQEKKQSLASLEIKDAEGEIDGEWFKVRGRVCNGGSVPVNYIKVQADFLDRSGNVVDTDWTYAISSEQLAPGACKSFEIMQRTGRKARKYRVYVQE